MDPFVVGTIAMLDVIAPSTAIQRCYHRLQLSLRQVRNAMAGALDQTTLADLIRRVEAARASGDPVKSRCSTADSPTPTLEEYGIYC